MTKFNLTATFSNGRTITRNSKTAFPFAWYSQNKWNVSTGFSSNEETAKKAAWSAFSGGCPKPHTTEVVPTTIA